MANGEDWQQTIHTKFWQDCLGLVGMADSELLGGDIAKLVQDQ